MRKEHLLIFITVSLTCLLLFFVRWKVGDTFLLGDRLFPNGGILQIIIVSILSGFIVRNLYNRETRAIFRRRLWWIFSVIFFSQLLLGIVVDKMFLLTGNLHYPVPSVILTGAIYRWELSFMPILFLVTVLLSGGAWCSHLCYFGAVDSLTAGGKRTLLKPTFSQERTRVIFLIVFILVALLLRFFNQSALFATIGGAVSGVLGLLIIAFVSRKYKTMVHCTYFCPIGTIVSYLKYCSPFRYKLGQNCTQCKACITSCRYGALSPSAIDSGVIGRSCTYCGDCFTKCKHGGFEYRFLKCSPESSEAIFIVTVSILYSLFICIARV